MSLLVVAAHPDDEVLGAGGTINRAAEQGIDTHACILSGAVRARGRRPDDDALRSHMARAAEVLGLGGMTTGPFPNVEFNTVPHIQLVQFVEGCIESTEADVLLIHHPADLNVDHRHAALASLAAARLFQRRSDVPPLRAVYYMEVLSSTDWSFPGFAPPFQPDTFVEIGAEGLDRKVRALASYEGVMREYPHPRSEEALHALATQRGAEAHLYLAEAFQTAFRRSTVARFAG